MVSTDRRLLLAGLLALGAAACNGDGGTQPDPTGPNRVRIDDPGGRLRGHETEVLRLVNTTLTAVLERLPVTGVTITVLPDASQAIGGYGIGGRASDAATVWIYIDPAFPDIGMLLPSRLPQMVAHELHHAVRHRRPGYGGTLFEAMISEGMADRFSVELLGVAVPPWSDALGQDQTSQFVALARPEFDSATYDHPTWFFGAGTLPRWTGYTLGYRLIEAYQADHPGTTAADLVSAQASAFRP